MARSISQNGGALSDRDIVIYAAIGLGVWLNGAITFRLGGTFLFESGALVSAVVAVAIAIAVCLIFRSTMNWRKAPRSQAVSIAVVMALPGLFGEAMRQVAFVWATGLDVRAAPDFSATIFFGNGVLLAYAVLVARQARKDEPGAP